MQCTIFVAFLGDSFSVLNGDAQIAAGACLKDKENKIN